MFQITLQCDKTDKKTQELETTSLFNSFMLANYSKSDVPFQRGLEEKPTGKWIKGRVVSFPSFILRHC